MIFAVVYILLFSQRKKNIVTLHDNSESILDCWLLLWRTDSKLVDAAMPNDLFLLVFIVVLTKEEEDKYTFWDASTHLYKRVCPSVRPWSVRGLAFFSNGGIWLETAIESLENKIWQIWQINLTNLSYKSILVPNFGRIFVQTILFYSLIDCEKPSALT